MPQSHCPCVNGWQMCVAASLRYIFLELLFRPPRLDSNNSHKFRQRLAVGSINIQCRVNQMRCKQSEGSGSTVQAGPQFLEDKGKYCVPQASVCKDDHLNTTGLSAEAVDAHTLKRRAAEICIRELAEYQVSA